MLPANWDAQKQTVTLLDLDQVNDYFVGIATDSNYNRDSVIQAAQQSPSRPARQIKYTKESIERLLAKTRKTSSGNDKIPHCVYRDCFNELAEVVANIVNMSVGDGIVPAA